MRLAVVALWILFRLVAPAPVQAAFVNWESPPVHGVDLTPDGSTLLVVNTADDRLEVFILGGTLPVHVASIPVGLDPVSVRARTNGEAWVVNRVSDSVSVVNLTTRNVVATLTPGDEPFDVVFAGSPARAFVSVSQANAVAVYDPANLAALPTMVPIQGKDPRALATDGTHVYVAIFESGNRSMILPRSIVDDPSGPYGGTNPPPNSGASFNPPIAIGLPTPPPTSLIVNKEGTNWKDDNNHVWDALVTWNLNENDVAVIQTSSLTVTGYSKNLLNIDMAIAVNPANGRVTVVGTYGPNEHRFEVSARSQFARNRIGTFDPTNLGTTPPVYDLNPHLLANPPQQPYKTSVTPAEQHASLMDPRGIVWKPDGSAAYVTGMGSNNVVKTTGTLTRLATIDVGQGPTSIVLDVPGSRLYVLNRFDGTVSSIDTATDTEVGRVGFYDPTPAVIKTGRPIFYDAHRTSLLGNVSCAGCHIDGTMDTEAWDLGDPAGSMKVLDEPCNQGLSLAGACNDWHPMKGPMMTQSLIGSVGTEPLHWRGDREDMAAFTVGFTGLLAAAAPPTVTEMGQLTAFLATIRFQPNPFRTFTDGLPLSLPGFAGDPSNGQNLFTSALIDAGTTTCATCHSGPTGANATLVSPNQIGDAQAVNVPQLSGVYKKTGLSFASQTNNRGFGFGHDGSADTVFGLLQGSRFTFPAGAPGDQERRDLEAFVMCFPTDTHPAVGTQVTVDGTNDTGPSVVSLVGGMTMLADAGKVGVVAKGRAGGVERGWSYLPGTGTFQADRAAEVPTETALRQSATVGGEITFTVVPLGTATRIGIDRDEDGYFDRDEMDAGSDPADPLSVPTGGTTTTTTTLSGATTTTLPGAGAVACVGGAPLVRAHAVLGHLLPPGGDDTFKLSTFVTVPTMPTLDPASRGLRVLVDDVLGGSLLDVTIPGGAHWTGMAGKSWSYHDVAASGIVRAKIRAVGKVPGKLKVVLRGNGLAFVPAPTNLPLTATVVFDVPQAATGQCGTGAFAVCTANASGKVLRCR